MDTLKNHTISQKLMMIIKNTILYSQLEINSVKINRKNIKGSQHTLAVFVSVE